MSSHQSHGTPHDPNDRMTRRKALRALGASGAVVVAATAGMKSVQFARAQDTPDVQALIADYSLAHHSGTYDGHHLAEDAVLTSPTGEIVGREAIAGFLNNFYAPIGDIGVNVDLSFVSDPHAAALYHITGVHSGPVLGVPPTGRPIDFRLSTLYEVTDSHISHIWAYFDLLGLFQELGGVPEQPAS